MKIKNITKSIYATFIVGAFIVAPVNSLFADGMSDFGTYGSNVNYGTYTSDFQNTNFGTYGSNVNYGTYTSDIPTTNFGTYGSNVNYGTYTSDTNYGTYTSDTNYGTYTSTPNYGTYTSDVNYGTYTSDINNGSAGYSFTPGYTFTDSSIYTGSGYGMYGNLQIGTPSWTGYNTTIGGGTTVIPGTNTVICSDGSYPINGTCNRTTTIPTTTNVICSDGSSPINGSCVRNNTIPTVNNTICSDGQLPVNGSCVRNTVLPVVQNTTCPINTVWSNGYCQQIINNPVITYQTCWDGSVVPSNSICPAQYKICANGTSVPINQACYQAPVINYNPPVTVKFNNVVTSVPTEITNNQGRCNAIGLIANGVPSTGWFEYGESASLGKTTSATNIGTSATAPFSNLLKNLKPSTKYYCRAVMQNQYGIVKGEIVSFTTKTNKTVYVKPVTKTVTKSKVSTPVKKKNEVICSDGTVATLKSEGTASLLNNGEKLVAIQMMKVSGELNAGQNVTYRLGFKNITDTRLSNVIVRVVIPDEISYIAGTSGNYDANTRTLTLNQESIDPYTEGIIEWTGNVRKNAQVGKSIVTTAYISYSVPGTNIQDEVTAYTVGSILPSTGIEKVDTGSKKVVGIGQDRAFLPNNLVEWLALIAIIFIIIVLGRSIYSSFEKKA